MKDCKNMSTPKVSIIIPTYNVENYLQQCLTSIAKQTYRNIEVIIIIDGATDRSFELAKSFCETDHRFNVYWQENAGSGPARNNGISKMTGEFVMFVDPDDWCKPDYVENMMNLQQKGDYDIVSTGATTVFYSDKGRIKKILSPHFIEAEYIGEQILHEKYLSFFLYGYIHAPHCKMYKANIIKSYGISFPDLRRSQDIVFNYRYFDHAHSMLLSNYSGYMYRVLSTERAKRLKPDYYKTIGIIYSDIKALHEKWGVVFDKEIASTFLFGAVYSLFESNMLRGNGIEYITEDKIISEIIRNAHPQKIHLQLVRYLVIAKHYIPAVIIIKFIFLIKQIFR